MNKRRLKELLIAVGILVGLAVLVGVIGLVS